MRRIYTKTGDAGTTGIHGGERVEKDDIRIEANGEIDELNAVIGVIRSLLPLEHVWQSLLHDLQKELMVVMSLVATPEAIRHKNPNVLSNEFVARLEQEMDEMMGKITNNGYFTLPGGTPVAAHLQLARTVARRAERRLWSLHKTDALPASILQLLNRMSDLFFVMARMELQSQKRPEEFWKSFAYKRKRAKE